MPVSSFKLPSRTVTTESRLTCKEVSTSLPKDVDDSVPSSAPIPQKQKKTSVDISQVTEGEQRFNLVQGYLAALPKLIQDMNRSSTPLKSTTQLDLKKLGETLVSLQDKQEKIKAQLAQEKRMLSGTDNRYSFHSSSASSSSTSSPSSSSSSYSDLSLT